MKTKPKKVKIKLQFTREEPLCSVGNKIIKEFKKKGIKITKLRYTYLEAGNLRAEMPIPLFLAGLLNDSATGFKWYLPELSGNYEFSFTKIDEG